MSNSDVNMHEVMMQGFRDERKRLKKERAGSPSPFTMSNSPSGSYISDVEDDMVSVFENIIWSVLPYMFTYHNLPKSFGPQGVQIMESYLRQGMTIPVGGTSVDNIHILTLEKGNSTLTWNPMLSSMMYSGTSLSEDGSGDSFIETDLGKFRPIDIFDPSASIKKLDVDEGAFTVFTNKSLATLAPAYTSPTVGFSGNPAGSLSDALLIRRFAEKLANIFASHSANVRNMRQSTVVFLNNQNPDALKIFEDVLNGVSIVSFTQDVNLKDVFQTVSLNTANYVETLQSAFEETWHLLWKLLGMSVNGVNKNSGVNVIESTSNSQITEALLNSYLQARRDAWGQLNTVFGCSVEVSLNSDAYDMMNMAMLRAVEDTSVGSTPNKKVKVKRENNEQTED